MNVIRDDFPKKTKDFFIKLSNYLDTELIFYGSVIRSDYIPGKSDIDVAIFTDNEYSIMAKLQHFLHAKRSDFGKVLWRLDGKVLYGYKIKCEKFIDINCEIAIYNNEYKDIIMDDLQKPLKNHPMLVFVLLNILKVIYYKIPILSQKSYLKCKSFILNDMMGKKDSVFYLLKQT